MKEVITLIGFGEAGQHIAQGLMAEGTAEVRVYDTRFSGSPDDALAAAATAMGALPCTDLKKAMDGAGFIFSLVVGAVAVAVGKEAARFITPEQIFIDLNSVSPSTKKNVALAVEPAGCFVEGAVMARVPPVLHKVPVLVAGTRAAEAARRLNAIGMCLEEVGTVPGQASANKMLRSVMIKGIEALMLECLTAAQRMGIEERILDSLGETFPGMDWRKTASYYLSRTALHGERRVTEMTEAAGTVKDLGIEPYMSLAAARRIEEAHKKFKLSASGDADAADYTRILAVLNK